MKKILISTTNSIQGAEIQKYIDIVFSNIVIGTNIFSDIGASFTDFFGGTSGIYKSKLNNMREMALNEIKEKAHNINANAIIGMKIDFDEISGKGKSMFMISISGTAVKVVFNSSENSNERSDNNLTITYDQIHNDISKRDVLSQIEIGILPSEAQWDEILSQPFNEMVIKLLPFYLSSVAFEENSLSHKQTLLINNYNTLIKRCERDVIANFLYSELMKSKNSVELVNILYNNRLFCPNNVKLLLDNNKIHEGVLCLSIIKEFYNQYDLNLMNEILNVFEILPNTGTIEFTKNGIFAKEKEMYICCNGHKNNSDLEFCITENCGVNIKGLTQIECNKIKIFRNKVESLDYLLKNQKSNDN